MINKISRYWLGLAVWLLPLGVFAQSASIAQDKMNEIDIRRGGKEITINLSGAYFNSFTDRIRQDIIDGFTGDGSFEVVKANMPLENVVRLSNRRARIYLPATPSYFINTEEHVTVVVPASALFLMSSPIMASPDVKISDRTTVIGFSGSLLTSTTETDIRNGGSTLTITADYNHWLPELATTQVKLVREIFGGITFQTQVAALIQSTHVTVDRNLLMITMPAAGDYYLGEDETVEIKVQESMFVLPESLDNSSVKFEVENEDPLVTLQNVEYGEEEIRSGNRIFTITMSGDKFIDPLNVGKLRDDFSGGEGWESHLESTLTFVRNNDFQVVATIPRYAGFDIDVAEETSLSLGHENMQTTKSSSFPDLNNRITLVPLVPTLTLMSEPSPLSEDNLDGALLIATLTETTLVEGSPTASEISIIPPIEGLTFDDPVSLTTNYFEVRLSFSGNLEDDATITLGLDGSATLYGKDLESNTLSLSSAYEPQVTSVSIPNEPMGIGDIVPVTITFTDNAEEGVFSYVAGTIEGEPLVGDSVKKVNNTTYTTIFIVQEDTPNRRADQSIRAENLQFSNGNNQGIPVDYDIVQDNDKIDTEAPLIDYIRFAEGSVHIIGSQVVGTVLADGDDYQFDHSRSSLNGVSFSTDQIEVENNANNTYTVTYIPEEGDNDVTASDMIAVELVMIDDVGNRNDPPVGDLFNDISPVIDANSPALDSAVVANPGIKAIGDEIEILLYATEELEVPDPPLEGTHVNFVPISSPNVVFEHVADNVYRLRYTVAIGDNGVNPGQLSFNLEMEDVAGNRSNSNIPLKNNNVTIGSDVPTAAIVGGGAVCLGDSMQAYIHFTGSGPWDAVVSNSQGEYLAVEDVDTPFPFWIKTDVDETFYISSVSDGVGNEGVAYGQLDVVVNFPTEVQIVLDRTIFESSEPGVELRADHEPGVFSGKGVSSGYFYPSIATPVGSPHTITYAYENQYGCVSYDEALVEVVEGSGSVHLLSGNDTISVLCNGQGTYEIRGANRDSIPGLFELRITNTTTVVPGHIVDEDSTDNMALFDASGLVGGYDILYHYVIEEVVLTASTFLLIDEFGSLEITSDLPAEVCKNDDPYILTGNMDGVDPLATYSFSGPGVTGDATYGFYYNPASPDAPAGTNEITYSFLSSSGCSASLTREVENNFVPDVKFTLSTVCLPGEGGTVLFTNTTSGKYAVSEWQWNFDDIYSGTNNYSSETSPSHFYEEPGLRSVVLEAVTHDGCVASYTLDTLFADQPIADFTWISDCFVKGEDIELVNHSESGYSPLESLTWTLRTSSGAILGVVSSGPGEDTISVPFTVFGNYTIDLKATNTGGCSDEISKELVLKPTVVLSSAGYAESFDESGGNWSIESTDGVESWTWGEPNFTGFEADPGDKAWFTDLPYGVVGYDENSWMQSPCLDFSHMQRPLIQVDIMKSFVPNLTGAVLQYQDVVEEGWKTVGLFEEGVSWYNSNTIFKNPGGSKYGWGLNVFQPDTDWVIAKHDLDDLAGNPRVKLRFIIGTNGRQGIGNQGFAFDNIFIAERTRYSVLEHFTNSSQGTSRDADDLVDTFSINHSRDVVDLQYHMDYPGIDIMNVNNPDPPSTRSGYYGIPRVPYSVLNGGTNVAYRYDFSDQFNSPGEEELSIISLDIPAFKVDIDADWGEQGLTTNITATCQADAYSNNVQLHTVVIETEVTAYTGGNQDTLFRNVVLDMLPHPGGKLLRGDWLKGMSVTKQFTWDYPSYVEDLEDLGVVAYVQDRSNGRILQSSARYMTIPVGRPEYREQEPDQMAIFPNPAREFFYVNLGDQEVKAGHLMVVDMSGKLLHVIDILPGYKIQKVEVDDLPAGIYLVSWMESGRLKGHAKLVRAR